MPELDGFETFKQMKNIHPKVKAIFILGYSETPAIQGLIEHNNVLFIRKPINVVKLTKKIIEILGND